MRKWKLLDTTVLCSSNFVSVFDDKVMLPSGQEITFSRVELRDFVSVLPLTENKIVMIEIFRYPGNRLSLEIPSGYIEDGETPKESAFRELEEETGYKAEQVISMGWFNPSSRSVQRGHLFLARNLKKGVQRLEETEQISAKFVPVNDIKEMLMADEITHAPTILALQKFLLMRQEGESFSIP